MLKKKGFWIGILSFFVLAWFAQSTYKTLSEQQEGDKFAVLAEGDTLPKTMALVDQNGKYGSFADYSGKVVLINYWAGWCPPCLKEMPSLYELQKKYADRGLAIVGVSMDDDMKQGLAILKRVAGDSPFPHFKGPEQAVSARFPIQGLPFTVIVDRDGKILYARAGERDWMEVGAVKFIEGLL